MKERTLVIDSLSKTYAMTGWRIGYAAGPEELIRNMVKLQENVSACAATPCQVAAIEALEGSQDHLKYMVEQYRLRRDYVIQRIAGNSRAVLSYSCRNLLCVYQHQSPGHTL